MGGGGMGGGGDGASTSSFETSKLAASSPSMVTLSEVVSAAIEMLSSDAAPETAVLAFGKSIRAVTCTDAAVTELTTASMASGKRARRWWRKEVRSKDSTVPATVNAAVSTLV